MRKLFLSILFLMSCVAMYAAQAQGATCSNPIPLGDNYSMNISGPYPKTVWYTAWTFDLPLSVYFIPENGASDPKPEVEMDFSCTSGFYTDSILCSLFCTNSGTGIQFELPHKPALQVGTTDEGDFCYYLAIGKEYRDLLLKTGIDYNVQVFVKVTYKSNGSISIAPDDMFTSCMDGAKFMHLGDTVQVKAQDAGRHVIVPYVQWQEDSIRYVWEGTQECRIAISNKCDFDPTDAEDGSIIDAATLQPLHDTLNVSSALLREYVSSPDFPNEAGMYFVKWYSTGPGVLKVEQIPMAPPQGGAKLLRYDRSVPIAANDVDALYAIACTWDTATIFTTPTDHVFKMYIGTGPDFTPETAIATYQFHADDDGHWLGLLTQEIKALWVQQTEGQYLYVRFECAAKTTLTPSIWDVPECLAGAQEIKRPSSTFVVSPGSWGAKYYRFYFREWSGGDMTFRWTPSTGTCPTFIGDNCDFAPNGSNPHVVDFKVILKNGSWTIPAADIAADWVERVDGDGYLYIRFNPGAQGTMTVSTTAPDEVDPAPIVYPASTIHVVCNGEPTAAGQEYSIRVSAEQELHIDNETPWNQAPGDTHTVTLQSGMHTLYGANETIQIEVK